MKNIEPLASRAAEAALAESAQPAADAEGAHLAADAEGAHRAADAEGAEQQFAEAPLTPDSMKLAVDNYAKHHQLNPDEVTPEQISKSEEGSYYWATVNQDLSARGPGSQALGRALQYRPDLKSSYAILLDSYKVDFRRAWMATRPFSL